MNMSQLKALVKKGESEVLEFKKSTAQLSAAMQTVCAFLNSDVGGTVLIGVTDDGSILGQEIADKTRRDIANELEKIEPRGDVKIEYVSVGSDRHVIVLIIKAGKNKPYVYDDRPYRRKQSTTQRMLREEYVQLLRDNEGPILDWGSLTTNKCTINDLDKDRIRDFVRSSRLLKVAEKASIAEVLEKTQLLDHERLTNAAVVLFCKNEQKQFVQSAVQLARFEGLTKSIFLDRKDIRGNIFDLLEGAMKFLTFNLPIAGRFVDGSPYRVDTPAIPYNVLREALLNALIHRDYGMVGSSIDVAIYDDRVEIDSPGRLPIGIEVRDLTTRHKSIRRNPLIANILYECGMIERWGRGTLEMVALCKQAGNPLPEFKEETSSFLVTLPLREPMRHVGVSTKQRELLEGLTSRQQEIMIILRGGSMSREQIMEKLKDAPSSRTVQKDLLMLYKIKLIAKSGGVTGRYIKWAISQ